MLRARLVISPSVTIAPQPVCSQYENVQTATRGNRQALFSAKCLNSRRHAGKYAKCRKAHIYAKMTKKINYIDKFRQQFVRHVVGARKLPNLEILRLTMM
jgi:hypothetical protein